MHRQRAPTTQRRAATESLRERVGPQVAEGGGGGPQPGRLGAASGRGEVLAEAAAAAGAAAAVRGPAGRGGGADGRQHAAHSARRPHREPGLRVRHAGARGDSIGTRPNPSAEPKP